LRDRAGAAEARRRLALAPAAALGNPARPARRLSHGHEGERGMIKPDPKLDLVLERVVDVPRALVWKAWTTPAHIRNWFVPRPWTITDCEIDLKPGGVFRTVMRSPEGQEFPNLGCYLEIVPEERLVWTDALLPGYRPSEKPFFT